MLRLNQNNLEEYLKKTEAEKIYMKKINSINMSFTSLLTSIQSVFSTYDYQLSTIANSLNVLNGNTNILSSSITNLRNSHLSLLSSFTSYTSSYDGVINSIVSSIGSLNTHSSWVDSQIDSLWSALTQSTTETLDYNYWKEFNKASQETYPDYNIGYTIVDNEQFGYSDFMTKSTILNPLKKSYVFNENVIQTSGGNWTFEMNGMDRIGLIFPSATDTSNPYNSNYQYSTHMNLLKASVGTLDVMMKHEYSDLNTNLSITCNELNLINKGDGKDYNLISTNIDCSKINLINYVHNNNTNYYSTWILNSNVKSIGNISNTNTIPLKIDLRRAMSPNMERLTIGADISRFAGVNLYEGIALNQGIGPLSLLCDCSITAFRNYSFDCFGYPRISVKANTAQFNQSITLSFPNGTKYNAQSLIAYLDSNVWANCVCNATGDNMRISFENHDLNNNMAQVSLNKIKYYTLDNYQTVSISYNTMESMVISLYNQYTADKYLDNFSIYANRISTLDFFHQAQSVLSFNFNTILTMNITNKKGSGISFGNNFKNTLLNLNSVVNSGTYYGYTNTNATVSAKQGMFKLVSFSAGEYVCSAGGSMENCTFKTISVNPMLGLAPYGPWRYVFATDSFICNSALTFYMNKLEYESAFYHCPFIPLSDTAINSAMNRTDYSCSNGYLFVDNAPTSSVNFRLTGNATSKSINVHIMESQPSILKVDLRGWHPSRIIGFGDSYLFNNVASIYSSSTNTYFTVIIDSYNDWSAYRGFFNPFGDSLSGRIIYNTS